jgi:hypothetical protein
MSHRSYLLVSAIIFTFVFLAHVLRLLYGWSAVLGGWMVPTWVSWLGAVVAGFLAYQGFRLRR